MNHPESSSSCIIDHNYNNVLLVALESLSFNMGFIPKNAINIMGTPFNLLIMFNASRVHLKCHIIMVVCIAQLPCVDCSSGVVCASVDQGGEVPPPSCDDPYYQHSEQGKRNPPLWACLILYFRKYFLHYNIACGSKCQFYWIRVSYSCIKFPMPLPASPPIIHRTVLLAWDT